MTLICISSAILESVLSGIIGNIIFAFLLLWSFQQLRYYYHLKLKFHNKTFDTYWKRFPDEIVQSVTCTVKGNVIKFKGSKIGNDDAFEGQFIMNPINLKIGEGFHAHKNSDGFAFLRIIIKDDKTLFVEAPYTGVKENENKIKVGFRVYQAFIWKRNNCKLPQDQVRGIVETHEQPELWSNEKEQMDGSADHRDVARA